MGQCSWKKKIREYNIEEEKYRTEKSNSGINAKSVKAVTLKWTPMLELYVRIRTVRLHDNVPTMHIWKPIFILCQAQ